MRRAEREEIRETGQQRPLPPCQRSEHCHSLGNSTRTAEWAKKKNEMSTNDGAIDQNAEWGNINMEKHEMSISHKNQIKSRKYSIILLSN